MPFARHMGKLIENVPSSSDDTPSTRPRRHAITSDIPFEDDAMTTPPSLIWQLNIPEAEYGQRATLPCVSGR